MTPAPPPEQVLHLAVAYPELPEQVMADLVPQLVIEQARLRGDESRVATEVHIRHAYDMEPVTAEALGTRTWVQRAKDLVIDAWKRITQDLFTDAHGKKVPRPRPMQSPPQQAPEPVHEVPVSFDPFEGLPQAQVQNELLEREMRGIQDDRARAAAMEADRKRKAERQVESPSPVPKDKTNELGK